MASEKASSSTPPTRHVVSNQSSKKRNQKNKRFTTSKKERDRKKFIDQCHIQSRLKLDNILVNGENVITIKNCLGEHQSQIFYGGFDICRNDNAPISISIGQATPISIGSENGASNICLAVPTYIFRRFPSSEYLAAHSPEPSSQLMPIVPPSSPGIYYITFKIYFPVNLMQSADKVATIMRGDKFSNHRLASVSTFYFIMVALASIAVCEPYIESTFYFS